AEAKPQAPALAPVERASVLLVRGHPGGRMAIPLAKVARLEEFPSSRLEPVGNRLVVQYRGQILPLVDVGALLDGRSDGPPANGSAEGMVQVVVCARNERPVGLIVGHILDIVEEDSEVRGDPSRPGVEYTTVVGGHVTELLDVEALIQAGGGGRMAR